MTGSRAMRQWFTSLVLACLLIGSRVSAQDMARPQAKPRSGIGRWGIVDAVGYGGVGMVAGYAVALASTSDDEWAPSGKSLLAVPVFAAAGMFAGSAIGRSASRRLRSGEPLSGGNRFAVNAGAVLGGATLGATTSFLLINPEREGTPLGSDEATVAKLMSAGAALGWFYVVLHRSDFDEARLSIAPIRTRDSAYGLGVSLRY